MTIAIFSTSILNSQWCVFVFLTLYGLFFLRRLGVELGKSVVYQEPNRGKADKS